MSRTSKSSRLYVDIHFSPNQPNMVQYMMGKQGLHIREITRAVGKGTYIRFYSSKYQPTFRAPIYEIDRIRIESYSQESIKEATRLLLEYRKQFKKHNTRPTHISLSELISKAEETSSHTSEISNKEDLNNDFKEERRYTSLETTNEKSVDPILETSAGSEVSEEHPEKFTYRIYCPYYLVKKVCGVNNYAIKQIEKQCGRDCFISYNNKQFTIQTTSGTSFSKAVHSMRHRLKRCEKAYELEHEPESTLPFASEQQYTVHSKIVKASAYSALESESADEEEEEEKEEQKEEKSIETRLEKAFASHRAPTPIKSPELKLKGQWAQKNGHQFDAPPPIRKKQIKIVKTSSKSRSSSPKIMTAANALTPIILTSPVTTSTKTTPKKSQDTEKKIRSQTNSNNTSSNTESEQQEEAEEIHIEIPKVRRFKSPFWCDSDEGSSEEYCPEKEEATTKKNHPATKTEKKSNSE